MSCFQIDMAKENEKCSVPSYPVPTSARLYTPECLFSSEPRVGRFAGLCYLQGRKGSLAEGVCSCHLSSWLQLSLNRTKQGATGKEVFREGEISY